MFSLLFTSNAPFGEKNPFIFSKFTSHNSIATPVLFHSSMIKFSDKTAFFQKILLFLPTCFLLRFCQLIAFCNHPPHIFIRHRMIQNNGIPMFFIQMICRNYRGERRAPELTPFRITFHIDPKMSLPLKNPCKNLSVFLMPDYRHIWIMKRLVPVHLLKCQAVCYQFFFFIHRFIPHKTAFCKYLTLQNHPKE